MMKPKRDWEVLLIGGASGVGKTQLSYPLARHYGVNLTEIDDFQVVLEKLTTPEQQPLLHYWRTNWAEFSAWSDEQHLSYFIDLSRKVFQPALEAVIANHLESGTPVILEGDFLLPELAMYSSFDEEANEGRLKALFICEEDRAQLAATFLAREGEEQALRVQTSWLKNEWLLSECDRLGMPIVTAQPWDTVLSRALSTLDG